MNMVSSVDGHAGLVGCPLEGGVKYEFADAMAYRDFMDYLEGLDDEELDELERLIGNAQKSCAEFGAACLISAAILQGSSND